MQRLQVFHKLCNALVALVIVLATCTTLPQMAQAQDQPPEEHMEYVEWFNTDAVYNSTYLLPNGELLVLRTSNTRYLNPDNGEILREVDMSSFVAVNGERTIIASASSGDVPINAQTEVKQYDTETLSLAY